MKKQFRSSALIILFLLVPTASWSKSHVYFSPNDKPGNELIKIIDEAKKKIHAAVYMFTDNKIATALINAKKRKVDVQVVVDKTTTECMYGKAYFLQANGVDVFVYSPLSSKPTGDNPYQKYPPLMHHKFAIIDKKLWTGSFNWTRSANYRNEENALLLSDQALQVQFEERFEMLKQKCVPVGAQPIAAQNQEPLRTRMVNFLRALKTMVVQP
ncbi:FAM83 family protein [Candidatus Babeliales bacterium]|nr:FAM83 family protein [Candidatus Babeliales bacterium]